MSPDQINFMLGMGIPALTPSTGRSIIPPFGDQRQFDLNNAEANKTIFKANDWPNRGDSDFQNWLHNDMKDVAYFFNYRLFDRVVDVGGLK